MDILCDIAKIVKDDTEHDVTVSVDAFGVTVELELEPYESGSIILPIRYEALDEFSFIPDKEYREKYNANEYGIDLNEIKIVHEIMEYFESHKKEINALCDKFSLISRKELKELNNK